jgi:hypothetical protein
MVIMQINGNLEELMYEAGLTAQGSWDHLDKYDQEAVLRLVRLVVYRVAYFCEDYGIDQCLEHFGVE